MLYSRKIVLAIAACVVLASAAKTAVEKADAKIAAAEKALNEVDANDADAQAEANRVLAAAKATKPHVIAIAKADKEVASAKAKLDTATKADPNKKHNELKCEFALKKACKEVAVAAKKADEKLVETADLPLRKLELERAEAMKDLRGAQHQKALAPNDDQTATAAKDASAKFSVSDKKVKQHKADALFKTFKDDSPKEEKAAAKAALDLINAELELANAKVLKKPEVDQKPLIAKVAAAKKVKKDADQAVTDKKAAEQAAAEKEAEEVKRAAAVQKKADDKAKRKKKYDALRWYKKLWIFIKTPKTRYDEARKNENADGDKIDDAIKTGGLGFFATLKHMFWPTSTSGYLTATAAVGTLAAGGAGGAYLYNQHTEKTHKRKNRTKLAFAAAGLGLAGAAVGGYKAYEHWQAKQNGQDELLEEDGQAHTSEKNESSPVAGSSGDKPSKSKKNKNDKTKPKKSKWMIWAAVIVLALAVIGGAVYYFLFMTEEGTEEDAVPEGMDQV